MLLLLPQEDLNVSSTLSRSLHLLSAQRSSALIPSLPPLPQPRPWPCSSTGVGAGRVPSTPGAHSCRTAQACALQPGPNPCTFLSQRHLSSGPSNRSPGCVWARLTPCWCPVTPSWPSHPLVGVWLPRCPCSLLWMLMFWPSLLR